MSEYKLDTKDPKIFEKKFSRNIIFESFITSFLKYITYFIIIVAGYLFLDIAINGSKALFTSNAPYINTKFITKKPQTLHVFEPTYEYNKIKDLKKEIINKDFKLKSLSRLDKENIKSYELELKKLNKELKKIDKKRKNKNLTFSDDEFRNLQITPSLNDYVHNTYAYSGGGIGPAIIGTSILVFGSIMISLIIGLLCAIYLSEYSRPGKILEAMRISILNLSGVPSIVFGLFGFGLFVLFLDWGVSIIAGWFTLSLMALPVIIAASEESLKSIPKGFREGSLALGASKWTCIKTNVLPYATPGILTSSIMGIARVAGETAPIMFTAAFALRDRLPWEGLDNATDFFFQGVMALPYHIYVVSSKIPQNEYTQTMQYGTALVFLVIVGSFALSSILLRIYARKKYKW